MHKTKRKLGSRIAVIAVALLMVLTVGLLAACNITDTVQTGLDALQTDIVTLYENGGATEAQLDEKQERIDAFINCSSGTLTPAQIQQLDGMQTKVDYMRNQEQSDFVLTISVENATLPQGENFVVSVILKNNTGQQAELSADMLFFPDIEGLYWYVDPSRPPYSTFFKTLEYGESIQRNISLAHYYGELSAGQHRLIVNAVFYIEWSGYFPAPEENTRRVTSNLLVLTVQ